jgi:hypothetical protein
MPGFLAGLLGWRLGGAQIQARRAELLGDAFVLAQGALDQAARQLALKVVLGRKPAFE